jgi:hypothetical protein
MSATRRFGLILVLAAAGSAFAFGPHLVRPVAATPGGTGPSVAGPDLPLTGACCILHPSGSQICIQTTKPNCLTSGGTWLGGVPCTPESCVVYPTGACCLPNGLCLVTNEPRCDNFGGVFVGGSCADAGCVGGIIDEDTGIGRPEGAAFGDDAQTAATTGACCLRDGSCVIATPAGCATALGPYQGNGTTCRGRRCPVSVTLGACCLRNANGNAYCIETGQAACEYDGGIYVGDGTLCVSGACIDPNDPTGACCVGFFNPVCAQVTEGECHLYGGFYMGNGTSCGTIYCGFDM